MAQKHIYLDDKLIKQIDRERAKESRSFSNYITMLIRAHLEKIGAKHEIN